MNKKTAIAIAMILGILIGFLVVSIGDRSTAPRDTVPAEAELTVIVLSEEARDRLEEILDVRDRGNQP